MKEGSGKMVKAKHGEMVKRRLMLGYTQTELAAKLGIDPGALCNIENNKRGAGPKSVKGICDALGCDFEDIFEVI